MSWRGRQVGFTCRELQSSGYMMSWLALLECVFIECILPLSLVFLHVHDKHQLFIVFHKPTALTFQRKCNFCFQTHSHQAHWGDPELCEWLGLQTGEGSGGQHGHEALGPPGVPAAPGSPPEQKRRDAAGWADRSGCLAEGHFTAVWSLPPLAWYYHNITLADSYHCCDFYYMNKMYKHPAALYLMCITGVTYCNVWFYLFIYLIRTSQ